jgi:hypothetical protein
VGRVDVNFADIGAIKSKQLQNGKIKGKACRVRLLK